MSPLELVDDRFEKLAAELRAARPVARVDLRERVRALEPARPRFEFEVPWRRLVPAVGLAVLAAALGVAGVLGIVHGSSAPRREVLAPVEKSTVQHQKLIAPRTATNGFNAAVPRLSVTSDRLQQYDSWLRVRVRDQEELSKRTQQAMRLTRKLGGYVAWANFSTPAKRGDSELQLQIPIDHVQAAIAAFSGYGTLVAQRIRLKDLQQRADSLAAGIQRLRAKIARGEGSAQDRARLAQLLHARASTVKRAQMASLALTMVVGKAKKAVTAPPSRFHRTLDDAGSVLLRELELLLYALLVAGPLLLLGLLGLWGARAQRRRADQRLLERAG